MRGIDTQRLNEPVVQRTVDVELQGADGMGDVLDGVALAMREVIHGVDAPFVTGAVMVGELDAVQQRVTEHHVGMGHVNFGTEHLLPFCVLAGFHFPEEPQVFLHGTGPPGAGRTGLVHGTTAQADFFLVLVVYIGQAALDEFFRPGVQLIKVVAGIQFLIPLEAQPLDVLLDGVHVLGVFLGGVGVVVPEVGFTAVLLRQAKIEADTLGMSQVQVTVGFRRETGHDAVHFAFGKVFLYDFFQKIEFTLFHNPLLNKFSKLRKNPHKYADMKNFSNFARFNRLKPTI